MTSEMIENERSVTQVEIPGGNPFGSSIKRMTRAICVLDRSRISVLARWADARSGAQITRLSTLVRTLIFWLVRILSAVMRQKSDNCSSTSSMRTILPAQGKRGPVVFFISRTPSEMLVMIFFLQHYDVLL